MKEKNLKHVLLMLILVIPVIFWFVTVGYIMHTTEGTQLPIAEEDVNYDCNEGWYDDAGNTYDMNKITFEEGDVDQQLTLHYSMPDDLAYEDGLAICFLCRGMDFEVYSKSDGKDGRPDADKMGERSVYEFSQNGAGLSGRDIGLTLQTVPINITHKGNEITFIITPTDEAAFILDMHIQHSSNYVLSVLSSRVPAFIASVMIQFFGLFVIFYTAFALNVKYDRKVPLYAWGTISIIVGILMVIQTQIMQALSGEPEFLNAFKYLLVIILAYPLALQADTVARVPHRRYSNVIGVLVALLVLGESLKIVFNKSSFDYYFQVNGLIFIFNLFMTIWLLIREMLYLRREKIKSTSVYLLAVQIFIMVVAIVDLIIYVKKDMRMIAWGDLIRLSYVIMIIITMIFVIRKASIINREAMLAAQYKVSAHTDALTGLPNRAAHIEKENELTEKMLGMKAVDEAYAFAVVALDLNYLKKVNDTFGHDVGDEYIRSAATALKNAIGENGTAYRIGGDEFSAFVFGEDPETAYQEVIKKLLADIDAFNAASERNIPLSFAYGHYICMAGQEFSIHDSERMADREMYECKRAMKAER